MVSNSRGSVREFILNDFVPTILSSTLTIVTTVFLVSEYSLLLMLPVLLMVVAHLILANVRNNRFQKVMMTVGLVERKLGYYDMTASDFTMGKDIRIAYFFQITGLFVNFGNAVFRLMNAFVNLKMRNKFLAKFMEFDQIPIPDVTYGPCSELPHKVEFSHVSFGYNGAEKEIVSDISFVLQKGRTAAIVGENGSGKTTIAKLLSGFLTPNSGEIQIDDKPLSGDAREYLSAIYQDFQLFAFSIRENIETAYPNRGDVQNVLKTVGMLSEVQKLKNGTDTFLYKAFEENGKEFSYGQSQKLATARALYKNAGIIVLDEPTSAYDSKAEYEIFSDFRQLIEGKTALLISHRLWSCKFCDEIMVVDDKRIVERGTHNQLMAIPGGKYQTMFLAQAQYYDESIKDMSLS